MNPKQKPKDEQMKENETHYFQHVFSNLGLWSETTNKHFALSFPSPTLTMKAL